MTRLENRLREACREAADTVRPEAVRGLDLKADRRAAGTQRAGRPRRRGRLLAPLGAAAAVVVIAVGASVVAPWLSGVAPGHTDLGRHASPPAAARPAAPPKYTVLINGTGLEVIVTTTGRVAGRLGAPAGQGFAAIAGTADDRTFFVAADLNPQTSCQAFFYRFSLDASGRPSALAPLPVPTLPGLPTALAAGAAGSRVAYSVVGCASGTSGHIGSGQPIGQIGVIDVAAGAITRHWSYTLSEDYTSDLSMSASGSLLGYSNFLDGTQVGRVLASSAPPGPDQRYSRVVIRQPSLTALSASGRLMYAVTGTRDQVLAAYDTANGQLVKVLYRWRAATQPGPVAVDLAGHYLLLSSTETLARNGLSPSVQAHRCTPAAVHTTITCGQLTAPQTLFVSINLATGAVTTLPFRQSGPAGGGTAAW